MNLSEAIVEETNEAVRVSDRLVQEANDKVSCTEAARKEAKLAVGKYAWNVLPWFLFISFLLSVVVYSVMDGVKSQADDRRYITREEATSLIEAKVPPPTVVERLDKLEEKTLKTEGKIEVLTEPSSPLLRSGINRQLDFPLRSAP